MRVFFVTKICKNVGSCFIAVEEEATFSMSTGFMAKSDHSILFLLVFTVHAPDKSGNSVTIGEPSLSSTLSFASIFLAIH